MTINVSESNEHQKCKWPALFRSLKSGARAAGRGGMGIGMCMGIPVKCAVVACIASHPPAHTNGKI